MSFTVGQDIIFLTSKTWANSDVTPQGTITPITNVGTTTFQVNVSGGIRNIYMSQEGSLFDFYTSGSSGSSGSSSSSPNSGSLLFQLGASIKSELDLKATKVSLGNYATAGSVQVDLGIDPSQFSRIRLILKK